ncbi:MAG: acyltransferase [Lachnospiraceae bacterium]|nr:acyltransferase [Lachnospiraceae bacterium]
MTKYNSEKRIAWIDFVKFLGVLFVLLSHMELEIPLISEYGYSFYVPIFFVLAGFVYQRKEESFLDFMKRKAKRLLIPYFGYSFFLYIFFFLKDYLLPGKVSIQALQPLLGIFYGRNCLYPMDASSNFFFLTILNSPMWFLLALFAASVLFEICIRISGSSWRKMLSNNILILAMGICIMYMAPILLPWSLDTVFLFEVFMSAGYVMKNTMIAVDQSQKQKAEREEDSGGSEEREQEQNTKRARKQKIRHIITIVILTVTAILLRAFNGPMNVSVGDFGNSIAIGVVVGILSSESMILLCYLLRDHIPVGAAFIGRSSLTIMCLHMFIYMFIKTGINILLPDLLSQDTFLSVFVKAMAVSATLAILTIYDLWRQGRGNLHGK